MHYSRKATAKLAPGQPLVFTALGVFESAPVVENVEVAAAAGGGGDDEDDEDDDDDDDDDDDNGKQTPSGGGIMWCPELKAEATTGG